MPDTCSIVWAKPTRSRHGPSRPNAGMRTITSDGFTRASSSHPRPNCSITRGEKFSITTSHSATSRFASTRPSSRVRSSVMPRLFELAPWNTEPNSYHWSLPGGRADAVRMPSGRCADSTWITSAPMSAHQCAANGPAHHAVKSAMRRPASGLAASAEARVHAAVPGATTGAAGSTAPVCSPSFGAGPKGRVVAAIACNV